MARFNKEGKLLWAKRAGGKYVDKGFAIAASATAVYVTGCYSDTADFSGHLVSSAGITDIFIAKYDTSGNFIWVKHGGGDDDDFGKAITIDSYENVLVTGTFGSDFGNFDTLAITGAGLEDIFLTKLDSSGNVLWYTQAGGDDSDGGLGITTDKNDNICISGYFYSSVIDFGNANMMTNYGSGDAFLAKYNTSGKLLWIRHAGGLEYDFATDVEADINGNLYITGSVSSDSSAFENLYIYKIATQNSNREVFAAAYDSSGNILWVNNGGEIGRASCRERV